MIAWRTSGSLFLVIFIMAGVLTVVAWVNFDVGTLLRASISQFTGPAATPSATPAVAANQGTAPTDLPAFPVVSLSPTPNTPFGILLAPDTSQLEDSALASSEDRLFGSLTVLRKEGGGL